MTSKCIEWMGAIGISKELLVEKYYRDCKVGKFLSSAIKILLLTLDSGSKLELRD